MKNVVALFCLMLCCSYAVAKDETYRIFGITGPVLLNVEKRLKELQDRELAPNELQEQLVQAIQPFGYLHPTIHLDINASIRIELGSPLRIASLKAQVIGPGAEDPLLHQTLTNIPLQIGSTLSMVDYNASKSNLINAAESLGYLQATFKTAEILIDEPNDRAEITLLLDTGPRFYFGQIQFAPSNIDPNLLHRFVPFHPGEPYSSNLLLQFEHDLGSSGYFNAVNIKPEIAQSKTTIPICVQLQPVSKYSYTIGGGYGTDTGLRGRAGLHVIPVNPKGHQFHATAQGSFTQNVLQTQYLIPGHDPIHDQYSVTGNFSNLNYSSGNSNALLFSLGQQHQVDDFQRGFSLNALYEVFDYHLQSNHHQFLLYPKTSWSWHQSENKLFSPNGYSFNINALGASKLALSGINMAQLSLDAKGAYTFDPLRLRLYGHVIEGLTFTSDLNKVPLSLALLLGGTENLKGYTYNSIGPGSAISYAGFELQKETKKNIYALGFFDVGYVNNPLIKNPQLDLGLGLMWVSPIGPIKFGLAQAIDNRFQRQKGANPRIIVSMGTDL